MNKNDIKKQEIVSILGCFGVLIAKLIMFRVLRVFLQIQWIDLFQRWH